MVVFCCLKIKEKKQMYPIAYARLAGFKEPSNTSIRSHLYFTKTRKKVNGRGI
nr:MAG TPA: hypothetical protein [Caudoviricetes sp.]